MEPTPGDADRADFVRRLQNYGLDESALIAQSFQTTPSSITRLSATLADSALRPVRLRTNDFNDVSRWIGVPDRVFDEIEPLADPPRQVKLRQLHAEAPAQKYLAAREPRPEATDAPVARVSEDPQFARDLARAFVYGDSRKLQSHAAWLGKRFPAVDVAIWPMFNVTVKSGSVLEFGPGPNVLVAGTLTIEAGGKVRALGSLKIDVTTMQRTIPFHLQPLNSALDYLEQVRKVVGRG